MTVLESTKKFQRECHNLLFRQHLATPRELRLRLALRRLRMPRLQQTRQPRLQAQAKQPQIGKLVDDTRRDLALRLIEDPRRPIGEITFELGFSQQSAFARAFRRWSGSSPTGYRETLLAGRSVGPHAAQRATGG